MIRMFGDQTTNDLAQQLSALEEEFQLKKLTPDDYENSKVTTTKNDVRCNEIKLLSETFTLFQQTRLLHRLEKLGHCLSNADKLFLENKSKSEMMNELEQVEDD